MSFPEIGPLGKVPKLTKKSRQPPWSFSLVTAMFCLSPAHYIWEHCKTHLEVSKMTQGLSSKELSPWGNSASGLTKMSSGNFGKMGKKCHFGSLDRDLKPIKQNYKSPQNICIIWGAGNDLPGTHEKFIFEMVWWKAAAMWGNGESRTALVHGLWLPEPTLPSFCGTAIGRLLVATLVSTRMAKPNH